MKTEAPGVETAHGAVGLSSVFEKLHGQGLPGLIVGVSGPSGCKTATFGVANLETRETMRSGVHFRIGSVSKLIIGLCLRRFLRAGEIELNAPVCRYLKDVPDGEHITIAQLAQHRTGFTDALYNPAFRALINADLGRVWTRDEALQFSFDVTERAYDPSQVRYSNTNAMILAKVIEANAAKPFQEVAASTLAAQIGDHSIHYVPGPAPSAGFARGYRYGRTDGNIEYGSAFYSTEHFNPSWSAEAGCYAATISDLLGLAKSIGSMVEECKDLFTSHEQHYALLTHAYSPFWGHDGDVPGYSACCYVRPDDGLAIAVLANLSNTLSGHNPATLVFQHLICKK
ncbi:MAG: serine hydrolase domain-containing protein [Pseudomonadota bacterium]